MSVLTKVVEFFFTFGGLQDLMTCSTGITSLFPLATSHIICHLCLGMDPQKEYRRAV